MEDHRDEDFSKPKVAFRAFGGEGQKLGRFDLILLLFLIQLNKETVYMTMLRMGKFHLRMKTIPYSSDNILETIVVNKSHTHVIIMIKY